MVNWSYQFITTKRQKDVPTRPNLQNGQTQRRLFQSTIYSIKTNQTTRNRKLTRNNQVENQLYQKNDMITFFMWGKLNDEKKINESKIFMNGFFVISSV